METTYDAVYLTWRENPEKILGGAAESTHWYIKWDRILDASRAPFYRWFSGAEVNTCYNVLDGTSRTGAPNKSR